MVGLDRGKLAAQLTLEEGKRRTIYLDSLGIPTIGIGHNLRKPLSDRAIQLIFEDDCEDVERELDGALPWWRTLSEVRQRVLADMCFNLGLKGLLKFEHTLKAVEEGRWAAAAKGMRSSFWARQVKGRAEVLARMMEYGQDPGPK